MDCLIAIVLIKSFHMADQKVVLGYWGIRGLAQPCKNASLSFSEIPFRIS